MTDGGGSSEGRLGASTCEVRSPNVSGEVTGWGGNSTNGTIRNHEWKQEKAAIGPGCPRVMPHVMCVSAAPEVSAVARG